MEAIGIIFFACLAFAAAILFLITCCFLKVNGKNPNDIEMFRSDKNDRMHRIREMADKDTNDGKISSHNQNVILFMNKKHNSNDNTLPKQNLERNNSDRQIDVGMHDVIDEGYQNGEGHQNDKGSENDVKINDNQCNSSQVQATSCYPNLAVGSDQGHSNSHKTQGIGHYNEGFSSHFSSSHHNGGWGHHSGDSGHHGHHNDIGYGNDGGNGDA